MAGAQAAGRSVVNSPPKFPHCSVIIMLEVIYGDPVVLMLSLRSAEKLIPPIRAQIPAIQLCKLCPLQTEGRNRSIHKIQTTQFKLITATVRTTLSTMQANAILEKCTACQRGLLRDHETALLKYGNTLFNRQFRIDRF